MESAEYFHAVELLRWQVELGVIDAIGDTPVDRYALPDKVAPPPTATKSTTVAATEPVNMPDVDPVAEATNLANAAPTLDALRAALDGFPHCDLKRGARNLVFSDGTPGARVMIVGEAPGREEDRAGTPFVGPAGQLLDKMLGAIDMGRDRSDGGVYITNTLPWRPPQNRDPKPEEIAMLKPFLMRHIALANPDVLVVMGNWACQALLGKRGITRLRGQWSNVAGIPALPMFHPAYLLRMPAAKREAWADLLALKARLARD